MIYGGTTDLTAPIVRIRMVSPKSRDRVTN